MSISETIRNYLKSTAEILSIVAPNICLFHCIVLPAMAGFLPLIGMHKLMHGVGDQAITLIVLAICLPVIIPGFLKHHNIRVLVMFGTAVFIVLFTNIINIKIDESFHIALTLLASALLIKANLDNRKLLAHVCAHHTDNN